VHVDRLASVRTERRAQVRRARHSGNHAFFLGAFLPLGVLRDLDFVVLIHRARRNVLVREEDAKSERVVDLDAPRF
jgi:hypothetical protein